MHSLQPSSTLSSHYDSTLLCPPFTSEYTEIYSTPLPAQLKPLDWWSESWEDDKWPAPNFQAGQHIHIPHVWWLIEINLGYSRATMGYSSTTHTLFQFLLALTLDFSLGWSCSTPWHVFFFFFLPYSMWVLSSLTRDWTCTPCIGSKES